MAVARIRSTRVTPEQAEGQREANRSGRRARAWSTLGSRLGREPRPHKHELELVLRPSASAAGSQGSLLRVYGNHAQVYTQLVESVLTICWSSPNSQRLSVYTRRPNWLRPPTLIIPRAEPLGSASERELLEKLVDELGVMERDVAQRQAEVDALRCRCSQLAIRLGRPDLVQGR